MRMHFLKLGNDSHCTRVKRREESVQLGERANRNKFGGRFQVHDAFGKVLLVAVFLRFSYVYRAE